MPPTELRKSDKIVWTNYGNSGIGKTKLLGEYDGPVCIVRPPIEHTDAIRNRHSGTREWIVSSWEDMWAAEEYARSRHGRQFDFWWLDSVSGFQNIGLDDIWAQIIDEKPSRKRYGLDQGDYGVNMSRLMRWCRNMVGAPGFHFGITSHPAEVEGLVRPDEVLVGPWVQGRNMPHQLVQMSNLVTYYELNTKGKRVLHTQLNDEYFAKDAFGAFKGDIINPTANEIVAAIKASRGSARRTARRRRRVTTTKGR